jgi:16S rRNA (guanine527-N7)-methyltransferase
MDRITPTGWEFDVSRETFTRLEVIERLLIKWNPKINLVSRNTLDNLWERHISDSAQIWPLLPVEAKTLVDIGSGGGFPALVLAALIGERSPELDISMIESDIRKCSFLRTVLREMSVTAVVKSQRIESAEPERADVITARALADLDQLLGFSELHLRPGGTAIFPKGINWKKEVEAARESWSFDLETVKSRTQDGAVILKIGEIRRV